MEKEFVALINTHRALIFKVCNLYCPDYENRRDLFQEIVLQLWRSFPAFRRESSGSTWI
ncbi:MAG: sigma-70 family RNA polymerase sigma factor, partial [Gemmatimonadaceae bacterium]|nr:sigma-70 family RNA polymerase sigma factor [Chitinophagaceae bacterium]